MSVSVNHNFNEDNSNNIENDSSSSSSEEDICDQLQNTYNNISEPIYTLKMLNLFKDFLLFTIVAVVTYATLINEPPKISKSPAAYPFFSKDSPIIDWYRGHLSNAIEHARSTSDIAFVMYYAPWDAESQSARKQFEITAKHMEKYVSFLAVNCWHPNGECRNKYNKVYGWPVLIAYPTHGSGIQYNGPIIAEYMIKFLINLCWPLKRQPINNNLIDFQDAYITVNLNTLPGSKEYAVLYTTVLKFLEKDPFQSVSFYVVPHTTVNVKQSLLLHLWNETLIYPTHELDWRPEIILRWIMKNLHQLTKWVAPSGTKSLLLSNSIYPGPSLVLFTPFNPLNPNTDYYNMLQEISQEYYNCENNIKIDWNQYSMKRLYNTLRYKELQRTCTKNIKLIPEKISLTTNSNIIWSNNSFCLNNNDLCGNINRKILDCEEDYEKYINFPNYYKTSMLIDRSDPKSIRNLIKLFSKEVCRQFNLANNYHTAIFENKQYIINKYNSRNVSIITGEACKQNQSLSFIVMDSLNYYHFAEKLGIDLLKYRDKSAAVIINEKMETHYILNKPINSYNIRKFIYNFTTNNLQRSFKSIKSIKSKKTHDYTTNNLIECNRKEFSIKELNSKTFLPTILQKNKAIIVFYYTKQCSFCNGISFIFLTVAKQLQFIENIQFARIDGELNILPWEYTMETFPLIIFFPPNRKSDSVAFPTNTLPITVSNLIGFILINLEQQPLLKLHTMWTICTQIKIENNMNDCIRTIRIETITLIEKTLKNWRQANTLDKQTYLHRLKQFKQLHLLFATQNHSSIYNYFNKLNAELNLK